MQAALEQALREPAQRVRRIAAGGQVIWLKQAEELSLRLRIFKGDSLRGLDADRRGLHAFAAHGLPVAPLLAEGPRYLATAEVGSPMHLLMADGEPGPERDAAMRAAAMALAEVHRAGLTHGRPKLRDICWDGKAARFIDLERFDPRRRGGVWMAMDLVILLHSIIDLARDLPPEADLVLDTWLAHAPPEALEGLRVLRRRFGWCDGAIRLWHRITPGARELIAARHLLDWPALARV